MSYQMQVPARSLLDQRLAHLRIANDVRRERSRFKAGLRRLTEEQALRMVVATVERPPDWAATWETRACLLTLRKWGKVRVKKAMRACGISELRCLGSLTPRQRRDLQEALVGKPRQDARS